MQVQLHHLPSVRSGMLVYPFTQAKAVLGGCADLAASMPESLTVRVGVIGGPDGAPVVFAVPTWCGLPAEGEVRVAPFLKLGTVLAANVETTSYKNSLTAFDAYIVNGQRTFMETCWLPALDAGGVEARIEAMKRAVSAGCAIFTHEFKGAASRVPAEATAFGLRRDHILIEILATFPDRGDELEERRHRLWARDTRQALGSMAHPGGYPNLLAANDVERAANSYGDNAGRLIQPSIATIPTTSFVSPFPPVMASTCLSLPSRRRQVRIGSAADTAVGEIGRQGAPPPRRHSLDARAIHLILPENTGNRSMEMRSRWSFYEITASACARKHGCGSCGPMADLYC
jgi:hypothetical protein